MRIYHDHPCKPIDLPGRKPIASTFTYDCDCGKVMIVEDCDVTDANAVLWGKQLLFNGRPPDGYIEIGVN